MITEDYVSFETAKLLKEKGFDEEVQRSFFENDGIYAPCDPSDVRRKDVLRIPTLQMAMKWLREIHNIVIEIIFDCTEDVSDTCWLVNIKDMKTGKCIEKLATYTPYEEAVDATINYYLRHY